VAVTQLTSGIGGPLTPCRVRETQHQLSTDRRERPRAAGDSRGLWGSRFLFLVRFWSVFEGASPNALQPGSESAPSPDTVIGNLVSGIKAALSSMFSADARRVAQGIADAMTQCASLLLSRHHDRQKGDSRPRHCCIVLTYSRRLREPKRSALAPTEELPPSEEAEGRGAQSAPS
jgi:hypothetical protein